MSKQLTEKEQVYNLVNQYFKRTAAKPEMLVVSSRRARMMKEEVAKMFPSLCPKPSLPTLSQYFGIRVALCEDVDFDWMVYGG